MRNVALPLSYSYMALYRVVSAVPRLRSALLNYVCVFKKYVSVQIAQKNPVLFCTPLEDSTIVNGKFAVWVRKGAGQRL